MTNFDDLIETLQRELARATEIPELKARGVPRMLERVINVVSDISDQHGGHDRD